MIVHPVHALVSATSRRTRSTVHLAEPDATMAICGTEAPHGWKPLSPLAWGILRSSLCTGCEAQIDTVEVEPA